MPTPTADPKTRLRLGRILLVSPFCLGRTKPEVVERAFELGVNFFFLTADMHWPLYEGLREGLRRLIKNGVNRDDFVLACVSYVAQPEFSHMPFEEAALEIPGIGGPDVIISGGSYESDLAAGGRVRSFKERAAKGDYSIAQDAFMRTRASGASFHSRRAAADAINADMLDIAFIRYNSSRVGARLDLFPHIKDDKRALVYSFKSTLNNVPPEFARSLHPEIWIPEVSDHYRFVLSEPKIDGILCAPKTIEELEAMLEAASRPPFENEDLEHMMEISRLYAESLRKIDDSVRAI